MSLEVHPTDSRMALIAQVLGNHLTNRSRVDLLVFWGRYPGGWFDRRAIRPFTRSSRKEIERVLDELVEEGVITCRADDTVPLYALTNVGDVRRAVEELPRLTPSERRCLLRQSMRQHGAGDDRQDDLSTQAYCEKLPRG